MHIQVHTDSHTDGCADLTQQVETVVKNALSHFGDRVTRVVVYLSDENSRHKFGDSDKRCVMEARLAGLQLITVSHQGAFLEQAIEGAAAKLRKTLQRNLQRIDSISKRKRRERADLRASDPLLKHDVEVGKRGEFVRVLRPLLACVGSHAWRELRIMEANGTLSPGKIALADLLDEVVTRAWCQFADRPRWMALELWLTKLLDKALEDWASPELPVQAVRHDRAGENTPQINDQEWSVCLFCEDLSMKAEDGAPSPQCNSAEVRLEAEEIMDRIHTLLGDLPKSQRHAYVLNILEAYPPSEIAAFQDRPEMNVRSDIQEARDRMRTQLSAGAGLPTTTGLLAAASAGEP